MNRRDALKFGALAAGAMALNPQKLNADDKPEAAGEGRMSSLVGVQSYCWSLVYRRENKNLAENLDDALRRAKASGIEGWEHTVFGTQDQAQNFGKLLEKHGLKSQSIYANLRLHESDWQKRVDTAVEQIRWVKPLGVNVFVVNPEPIDWGKALNKNDEQLKTQAKSMQALGEALNKEGVKLAYHIHSPEMRASAREFHHTMIRTDKKAVGMCLDAHWIFRGAENSEAALYDIIELYGERIVSLHLRQSHKGIWSEALEDGDIDYKPLAQRLKAANFNGPTIIEQCFESGTPFTMPAEESFKKGRDWVKQTFGV